MFHVKRRFFGLTRLRILSCIEPNLLLITKGIERTAGTSNNRQSLSPHTYGLDFLKNPIESQGSKK